MRIKGIALLALLLALTASCALAQTLPGVDVFSPGLVRLSEKMAGNPAVHMEATLSAADAFHTRDLSVLGSMLDGSAFIYDGAQQNGEWTDRLAITRGGETLLTLALEGDAVLAVNDRTFAIEEKQDERAQALLAFLQRTAILERAPLAEVENFLLSLRAGDELFAGYHVAEPFASVQTMSDDGTRLTRIHITGSIAREGEAPWVIEGYLKQPAGRAPKDTFELTATQDEKNFLELSYSSLRQSEITKKNKAGKSSVDTAVKIAGKIGGYRISSRLTVYLRNTWTADGENLDERVAVNATLEHQDNTPGREMQRLNKIEAKLRNEIRLTTAEGGNDAIDLTDAITLSLVMDDNTVLDLAADTAMRVGGEAAEISLPEAIPAAQGEAAEAIEDASREMARALYRQLGEQTKEKIRKDLEAQP